MTINKQPVELFFDLETTPLKAWIWRLGKQVVRHNQLDKDFNNFDIICITYCFNDGKPAKVLSWLDYTTAEMVAEFDKIVRTADITIGKNNHNFDDRRVNTQRMLLDLPPYPDWVGSTDDLEKQMRKYFTFPSHSLDYVSKLLGLGGKDKMDFQDWIDIMEDNGEKGIRALKKMVKYGKKDVEDTREVWNRMKKHMKPKLNRSVFSGEFCCVSCGSKNVRKDGTTQRGKSTFQRFFCKDHGGYAGRRSITAKTSILTN